MAKLQLDIPDELNKELKMYKIKNDFQTIAEANIDILKNFFSKDSSKLRNTKGDDKN